MYFIFGLVTLASVAQALPIPSAVEDGAAILMARSPGPRLIPGLNNSLSGAISALGLHIDVGALSNAIQNEIADQPDEQNAPGPGTGTKTSPGPATSTANNSPSLSTPIPTNTENLIHDIVGAVTSTLTSALNDSDEHDLDS